jgi:hypothetical protein
MTLAESVPIREESFPEPAAIVSLPAVPETSVPESVVEAEGALEG